MSSVLENTVVTIPISTITVDENRHQVRTEIDHEQVEAYRQAMEGGAQFPPLRIIEQNGTRYLAEGFHRYHAYLSMGATAVPCLVSKGNEHDIVKLAIQGNSVHGLRLTRADRNRAVIMLLESAAEHKVKYTDKEIGDMLGGVPRPTIQRWRTAWEQANDPQAPPPAQPDDEDDDDLPAFDDDDRDDQLQDRPPASPDSDDPVIRLAYGVEAAVEICRTVQQLLSSAVKNFRQVKDHPQGKAFAAVAREVEDKLEWLNKTFEGRAPECVCPACNAATDSACKRCRGLHYLTADEMRVWKQDQQAKRPQ